MKKQYITPKCSIACPAHDIITGSGQASPLDYGRAHEMFSQPNTPESNELTWEED